MQRIGWPIQPGNLLAVASDGETLACAGKSRWIVLWDAAANERLSVPRPRSNPLSGLVFTPDIQSLVCAGSGGVEIWSVRAPFTHRDLSADAMGISAVAISSDGRTVATGGHDGGVRLWEMRSGKQRRAMFGPKRRVACIAFSADGTMLASGSGDGTVRLWDAGSGKRLHTFLGHRGAVSGVAFLRRNAALVTAGHDGTALVWDVPALLKIGRAHTVELTDRQLRMLWGDLGHEDARAAYEAMETLARAPAQVVPFLRAKVPPVSAKKLSRLLKELDDDDFVVRSRAMKELARMGKFAEASLRKLLANRPTLEARKRAEQLLERLTNPSAITEHRRALRGVEVLEKIGTKEAQRSLRTLADGADEAPLTREAKASLMRLERKSAPRP